MKDFKEVPVNKILTNKTGNDITFDLRDDFKQNLISIPNDESLTVTIKTSDALAMLYKKCDELGILIDDDVKIKLSFKPTSKATEFKKGETGTVRFDKVGTVNVETNVECIINSLDDNFVVDKANGIDSVFLNNNLDVGIYKCKIQATDGKNHKSNIATYDIDVIENTDLSISLDIQYNNCIARETGTNAGDIVGTLTILNGTPEYKTKVEAPIATWKDNSWSMSAFFRLNKTDDENVYNIVNIGDLYRAGIDWETNSYIFPLKFYVTDSTKNTVMAATEIRVLAK